MLRLVFWLAFVGFSVSLCPKKYDLVRNGECYRQKEKGLEVYAGNGPSNAVYKCGNDNAMPVIIRNQEDQDYWWSVAKKDKEKYGGLILGIVCDKRHELHWADGSDIDFRPEKYDADLDEPCQDNGYHFCMFNIDAKTGAWKAQCNIDVTINIYCTIVPPSPSLQPDDDCAEFEHDDDDNVCYQVGASPANWTEANSWCKSFGSSVASIHNDQENSFIRRLAASKGLLNGIMLGGIATNNNNKWIDGSVWDYNNFAPGFPIDGVGECTAMETNTVQGQWMNIDCSAQLPFACIRKTTDRDPTCDGTVRKEGEIIYSPGFPFNSSAACDFILMADSGKLVEVEILLLEANSCCDHLILTEGTLGGAVLADLTGDKNDGMKIRTKTQNSMRVSWQPNGATNVRGMMITFRSVTK